MPNMQNLNAYTYITSRAYLHEISKLAMSAGANDTILLSTMAFDPRVPEVNAVVKGLIYAAKNGANVYFVYDAQSYMLDPVSRVLRKAYDARNPERLTYGLYTTVKSTRVAMDNAGIKTYVTNIPSSIIASPYHGRSHIKCCVINDIVYIGGCNLSSAEDLDGMLRLKDQGIANWIQTTLLPAYEYEAVGEYLKFRDTSYRIGPSAQLFLDAGKKHQSIIYENALRLIDEAQQSLMMTCQFFPSGKTAKHLAAASERGVSVQLYYNTPKKFTDPLNRIGHSITLIQAKKNLPKALFSHELSVDMPYLHAKILTSEKSAMIGSHNFVHHGVSFGTAEICIKSDDTQFASYMTSIATALTKQ